MMSERQDDAFVRSVASMKAKDLLMITQRTTLFGRNVNEIGRELRSDGNSGVRQVMNALTGDVFGSSVARDQKYKLRTHVTHFGFSITVEPRARYDQTFLAEMLFKLVGVLFIPAGGIVLFLPRLVDGAAFVATQIGLLAAFIFVGVAIHRRADRGFRRKIYVDSSRGEVRTGTLNVSERFHPLATYQVSNIESFFIVRSKDAATPAKLKMRLKVGAQTIPLVEGSESSLVPILERITLALSPPEMRNRRYKTQPTGEFIRMTFE